MRKENVLSERSESKEAKEIMIYYVYILRTSSNTLYIGQTNNLEKRIREQKNKSSKSAKYIRYFPSFEFVYSEKYPTRSEAMQREKQLKGWTRAKKEALIRRYSPPLHPQGLRNCVGANQMKFDIFCKPPANYWVFGEDAGKECQVKKRTTEANQQIL